MLNNMKAIIRAIKKAKSIALFTHISPDFDALGSSISLYYALKQKGKNVNIFINDQLTEAQKELIDENIIKRECNFNQFDLFICTDTPSKHRLGVYGDIFINAKNNIVLDHHLNDKLIGKYNYIDSSRSSCSEISYELIKNLHVKLTPQISSLLYMGLTADTNSFINSNTNTKSLYIAYKLAKEQANLIKINEVLYRKRTIKEIELKKYLWNNYVKEDDITYCLVSFDTLNKLNANKSDCDFFSTELISLQGTNISFSIIESSPNFYEISFRSKSGYDVRNIASILGGGGHVCAAGAKVQGNKIEDIKDKILEIIKRGKD